MKQKNLFKKGIITVPIKSLIDIKIVIELFKNII